MTADETACETAPNVEEQARDLFPSTMRDELTAANAMIEVLRAQCKTQLDAVPSIVASARADALAESAAEIAKLHAQVERLWKALTAAENGFERLHNALLGAGPKQACGEMADHFLTEARAALAQKEG